jgi:SSS family solute:Na+ symporter/sodium/pantothenate symporter
VILVLMGVAAFAISIEPPRLLGIFGQLGVYGIVAASTAPILFGILVKDVPTRLVFGAAIAGLATHLGLYGWSEWAVGSGVDLADTAASLGPLSWIFDTSVSQLGLRNPGVTATYGILLSIVVTGLPLAVSRFVRAPAAAVLQRKTEQ